MAQKDVSPNMRAILVDWLVKVAEEYELHYDTLHLSISYIDRFLSMNDLNRNKLQLLGFSSMLIASMRRSINHPPVDEFCYLTDNAYTKKEVVKMEADIFKHLKFEVGGPTIMIFLGYYFTVVALEDYQIPNLKLEFLGYYLAELSLLENDCVILLPSLVAVDTLLDTIVTTPPCYSSAFAICLRYCGYAAGYYSYNASLLLLCLRYLPSLLLIGPPPSANRQISGIPEVAMPMNQATFERAETGAAAAAPVSRAPYSSPLNLFPQETISHSGVSGVGSLDFLRNNQQFQALPSMVHTNAQILQRTVPANPNKNRVFDHRTIFW
ncbi:G2/mitotic-specific cyclin C13-1-like [Camellia sinensis]|uniref:G2/mitotic-specific cyclin C13-1-like n=1 Tax=Camellia sinensis TaxID=4442 RepID=UPI001036DBB2|nr:G2/mitotic-specific cyclin C13-1-like [Camellia sinensis]